MTPSAPRFSRGRLIALLLVAAAVLVGVDDPRTIGTTVLFIGILTVLVIVHEIGHFVVARLFGVRVLEFEPGLD